MSGCKFWSSLYWLIVMLQMRLLLNLGIRRSVISIKHLSGRVQTSKLLKPLVRPRSIVCITLLLPFGMITLAKDWEGLPFRRGFERIWLCLIFILVFRIVWIIWDIMMRNKFAGRLMIELSVCTVITRGVIIRPSHYSLSLDTLYLQALSIYLVLDLELILFCFKTLQLLWAHFIHLLLCVPNKLYPWWLVRSGSKSHFRSSPMHHKLLGLGFPHLWWNIPLVKCSHDLQSTHMRSTTLILLPSCFELFSAIPHYIISSCSHFINRVWSHLRKGLRCYIKSCLSPIV